MKQVSAFLLCLYFGLWPALSKAQPDSCNIPLVGKGRVIDRLTGGTACLICDGDGLENIIDGDLSNYASYDPTLVLLETSVVSVKDLKGGFEAGSRAGFVVQPQGGLLSASILGSFKIKTYLNNVLQETIISGSGLTLSAIGASGGKQRISFVTGLDYDEIELLQTGTIGAFSGLRVFYAFSESADGCDYDCLTKIIDGSPYSPNINNSLTGIFGICAFCLIDDEDDVLNTDTSDFGRIYLTIGLGVQGAIGLNIGDTIPAGFDAGFVIAKNGGGILDATVLGAVFIQTYLDGALQETAPFSSLADVTVTPGNKQKISFKTTKAFNQIRIRFNSLVALLVDVNVFYAFVRPDDDNDGFPNCVDKCAGEDDNYDADGDGIPDACDTLDCMLNAGLDIKVCPPDSSAQLLAAGAGESWSIVAGNPAAASIDNSGFVSGMTIDGTYFFQLNSANGCHDTIAIVREESSLSFDCNNPITGFGITSYDPSGGDCLLCLEASLVVGNNLSVYAELDASLPILVNTPLIGIEDTLHEYPAGRRVGFVVEAVGGLIDLTLLGNFEIQTYLNGNLQETADINNTLLYAGVIPGTGNKQRISFVTSQPFNAVVLIVNATLSTIDSFRVYYAFEEPESCPDPTNETCGSVWNVQGDYCANIVLERSGIDGLACVACVANNLGNFIDNDDSTYTTIYLTVGVGAEGSVSAKSNQTFNENYDAGFIISGGINLLDASILGGIQLRSYLDGALVDNYYASNPLVDITLLGNTNGLITFKPTGEFNELRITVYGLVSALESTRIYGVFTRPDSDGDGTPDCLDKCCLSSDDIDTDGDGAPDACDTSNDPPLAVDDVISSLEDTPVLVPVLENDGDPNFDTISISFVTDPPNGTAVISGDSILYSPDSNYTGIDSFQYVVCDIFTACDTAWVFVNLLPVNDAPIAVNDLVETEENTPLVVPVLANDMDVEGQLDTTQLAIISNPQNGTALPDLATGTIEYTPDSAFFGIDTFAYVICDQDTPSLCDTALVIIEVNATHVLLDIKMRLQGALYNSPDSLMRDDLRANHHLPILEPYTALAPDFVHVGTGGGEMVSDSAAVFAESGANSIVDWVFVELRDSANPALVVATRAGLLQRDGDVVDVDGTSLLEFTSTSPKYYSVAIRHRNHLGCMTELPVSLSASGTQIDFRDTTIALYDDGTNLNGLEQIKINGKYALWAGNVNKNHTVVFAGQNNDKNPVFNLIDQAPLNVFKSQTYIYNGYHLGDVNLNGKAVFAGQNNDVDPIFNNVDSHPKNLFKSQTFIIREQLAGQ